ncbi:unnamed protein product [Leptidea sinapis]|uniref:Uncharacterized protein n=1 Tax=Leptidea sinapis TaxID=189913 RepID=A0A5E4QKM1_9NEOP|nr:unnamed protein product [Leptidea sinapis]
MLHFYYLFCVLIKDFVVGAGSDSEFQNKVNAYFKSANFDDFQKHWQKDRRSYENAIGLALKENYGFEGMNVYIRKSADSQRIASGFYFTDNVVGVALRDIYLIQMPHIEMPQVTFALASNAFRLEAGLSKVLIHSQYFMFRNYSVIQNGEPEQNFSPFALPRVDDRGQLAIVADDCMLVGYAITTLNGQSVSLGHDTFKVERCKFSIEISSFGMHDPPVIAPYFDEEQGKLIEKLITKPIRQELIPKLQAALLTYINTTVIFHDNLTKYRQRQRKLFKYISSFLTTITQKVNRGTAQTYQGVIDLRPLEVTWTAWEKERWRSERTTLMLKNIKLFGLDTLYTGHNGGAYKLDALNIAESLRYNFIQVQGKYFSKSVDERTVNTFVAEISDVTMNVEFDALISGHLLNEVSTVLTEHLLHQFKNCQNSHTHVRSMKKDLSPSGEGKVKDSGNIGRQKIGKLKKKKKGLP